MNTPICDFLDRYAHSGTLRLHMPGHKGVADPRDITEIGGADSLYEANGIIAESEQNAGELFGCRTFYSTEGSSQCIRAMLYLAVLYAAEKGERPRIAAGRNVHKAFVSAAALLDVDVTWLYPSYPDSYLSCALDMAALEQMLREQRPTAVYLTSPDYLGNTVDLAAVAALCHRCDVLLLVDNAHGAYLKFLPTSRHPMDLGADLCCDSAHKTLPVLTGGAYLHVAHWAPASLARQAKTALALFGSTSPSYLILRSLDAANGYLAEAYRERLACFIKEVDGLKNRLRDKGHVLRGDESLKLTIYTKPYGYEGTTFANLLAQNGVICEFADPDFTVMMLTPETGSEGLERLEDLLLAVPPQRPIAALPPAFSAPERMLSIRQAVLSPGEAIPAECSEGRILSAVTVGCPPAVPLVVSGERIDGAAIVGFRYYGVTTCTVVKE